jgi:hypothetical protein
MRGRELGQPYKLSATEVALAKDIIFLLEKLLEEAWDAKVKINQHLRALSARARDDNMAARLRTAFAPRKWMERRAQPSNLIC